MSRLTDSRRIKKLELRWFTLSSFFLNGQKDVAQIFGIRTYCFPLRRYIHVFVVTKIGLDYILGEFLINSCGHPARGLFIHYIGGFMRNVFIRTKVVRTNRRLSAVSSVACVCFSKWRVCSTWINLSPFCGDSIFVRK
jgi:hypothetical protein